MGSLDSSDICKQTELETKKKKKMKVKKTENELK